MYIKDIHFVKLLLGDNKSNNIKISMRCAKTSIPMGIEDLKNNIYLGKFEAPVSSVNILPSLKVQKASTA